MATLRKKLETRFEQVAYVIYDYKYFALIGTLLIAAVFLRHLPTIKLDTSTEGFFHKDDPVLITYNDFRDQFGREEMIAILINPPAVFDFGFLEKLKSFHLELEEQVPYLDKVTSLINARNTQGNKQELIVEDLFENWPNNDVELKVIQDRVLSNPLYKNMLISEDGLFTSVIITTVGSPTSQSDSDVFAGFETSDSDNTVANQPERTFLTDKENSAVIEALGTLVEKYHADDFSIHVAGSPVLIDQLKRYMVKDMRKFTIIAIAGIAMCLFLMFKRVSGIVFPLIIVIFSLLSTFGLMAAFGSPIMPPTQILPSFLLAVSIGSAVHILAIFYRKLHDIKDRRYAIAYALGHSGLAVVMASLTTAAGLLSFSTAGIAPIADLGKFAAAGVLFSLLYTIILIPALVSLFPIYAKKSVSESTRHGFFDDLLCAIARISTRNPTKILIVLGIVATIAGIGIVNLRFYHNPLEWFPENHQIRQATKLVDENLKGSVTLEMIVDTGKVNGLYNPVLLKKMDTIREKLVDLKVGNIIAGKTLSIADMLKEIHQALNENRSEFYKIPNNSQLIAQEFLLFENSGSDDLEDFVDSQFSKARFTIKTPWSDAQTSTIAIETATNLFQQELQGLADVSSTGMMTLFSKILHATMLSTAKSYLIAFVVITIMMVMLIGSLKIGLAAMIPNLGPILLTLGLMGILGLPLDMFTMLIGSIAIGLAVDDTIHFMHNFRRYYHETQDVPKAVQLTLQSTGRAMFITTVVLSIGFFMFMLASMNNVFNFGLLTGFTIMMALVADFFVAPALMVVLMRSKKMTEAMSTT